MKYRYIKRIRRLTSFAVIFALCCGIIALPGSNYHVNATSSVASLEEKIKEIEARNEEIDKEIENIEGDISDNEELQELALQKLNSAKEQLDYYNNLLYYKEQDIANKQAEIEELDLTISAMETEIEQQQQKIDQLQAENDANLETFGDILYAMYVTGGVDIFSVLADSADIYDLLIRTKLMMNISQQNLQFMEELNQAIDEIDELIDQLNADIDELETYRKQLVSDMEELEAQKEDLSDSQAEAQQVSDDYNSAYNYYSQVISDFESKQQALMNEMSVNAADIEAYEKEIQKQIQAAQQGSSQVYEQGEWMWPVGSNFHYITTYFGYDSWRNGNHSGIDIGDAGINGTNIYATKGGTVITAHNTYIDGYSYGKYIVIDHGDGYSSLYGHCSAIYVTEGQVVQQGDVIGAVGSTGWSTGPHLHFEIRIDGIAQDPFNYVSIP